MWFIKKKIHEIDPFGTDGNTHNAALLIIIMKMINTQGLHPEREGMVTYEIISEAFAKQNSRITKENFEYLQKLCKERGFK